MKLMTELKTRPRKTIDDFMKLPEGALAELIDGEILMSPTPKVRHQEITLNLTVLLRDHVRSRGLGRVIISPMDVHLPSGNIVEPDVIFISRRNESIIQDWIRGVPDLLIEVVSPTGVERDRLVKRDLYARNGVPEYWIVDPTEESVELLLLKEGRYAPHGYFLKTDGVRSSVLPQLELPVASIFQA
ncbi:MAG: Uma2 family endonuclease [Planctomycetes bacterium]|nr:Uma2 family endonuclease [Planctomycetota bacterium]